jgi:hypothetical protein
MVLAVRSLLVFALVLAAAVPASATTAPARVWISSETPLVVRGAGFHASARVAVKVTSGDTLFRKSVVSRPRGGFVARWMRSLPAGCHSTSVVARDSSGRKATYDVAVDDCPPPPPKQ